MSDNSPAVVVQEATSIRVGRWLLKNGYIPANRDGFEFEDLVERDSWGILSSTPAIPARTIFWIFKQKALRKFLGVLWFSNGRGATRESCWILEIFGRHELELLKPLAEAMASEFKVKVILRLISEKPRLEPDYDENEPAQVSM